MADNVAITAGSGTTIATDDVSGTHYQRMKLVSATDGSSTATGVDADPLVTRGRTGATATLSSVNDTASSTTLLASNSSRQGATIYNDSTQALYVKLGATASTSSFNYKLEAGDLLTLPSPGQPLYTGVIDGIWAADASGAARITEFT